MFELGQPLHAFDYDRIGGKKINVRQATAGEKITSLDGHERLLTPPMLVIADESRPVALAGVMGGLDSEVSAGTTTILLESARFDPLTIRTTARALSMGSDSSYRFERGIDPALPRRAADRAAELIAQLAGGEVLGGIVEAGEGAAEPKKLAVRLSRIKRVLGIEVPVEEAVVTLSRLGLAPLARAEAIDVVVPSYRLDLNAEVDLVEEVARVIGYDRIPVNESIPIRVMPADKNLKTVERVRAILTAAGYFEAVTFSFVADSLATAFLPEGAASLPRAFPAVRKVDAHQRPSVLPGLLQAVRHNEANDVAGAKLFEIGSAFWHDARGQIVERRSLALVGGEEFRQARGVVETLLKTLNAARTVVVLPVQRVGYAPGAAGRIVWGETEIGTIGKIDPAVGARIGLRQTPVAAELDMTAILMGAQPSPALHPLPKYPAVRRDISLVVGEAVHFSQVAQTISAVQPDDLEEVEFVTAYRGKPLEKGTKSMTLTLVFRSHTGTLTGEKVDEAVSHVVSAAKNALGATQRTI
jgi:phenylalanyl-tRNA synthetase beta chain